MRIALTSIVLVAGCATAPEVEEAYQQVDVQGTLPQDDDADALIQEFLASGAQFGIVGDPGTAEVATLQRLDRAVGNYGFAPADPAICLDYGDPTCATGTSRTINVPMVRNVGDGGVDVSYRPGSSNWTAVGQNCNGAACPQDIPAGAGFGNWVNTPNYGATTSDDALEAVMRGIRWTSATQTPTGFDTGTVTVQLGGLTAGNRYKAQLLFAEQCCDRGFHVVHDRQVIAESVNPGDLQGGISVDTIGAVVTHEFTATAATTEFVLDARLTAAQLDHAPPANAPFPDNNPILNGFTLEAL
ncbi:MAG: hypothetical protein H6737_15665 [Alphaproteobacteria bacterium]|nr:hypothetical protein [Alphaproteobacteria bacterium]